MSSGDMSDQDTPIEDQNWTPLTPTEETCEHVCPHCNGDGDLRGANWIRTCPTCHGEKTVTAEQHAQWQEAHGDLRDRVRELERQVADLLAWKDHLHEIAIERSEYE